MCFTYDYLKICIAYSLKEKLETAGKIAEMLQIVENQCVRSVRTFQCVGGREFDNMNNGMKKDETVCLSDSRTV